MLPREVLTICQFPGCNVNLELVKFAAVSQIILAESGPRNVRERLSAALGLKVRNQQGLRWLRKRDDTEYYIVLREGSPKGFRNLANQN